MQNPLVSIITPIYGVEKYMEKCARSLFEQTYDNIEYIFVNDDTKDNSIKVLKSVIEHYPARESQVLIINHKENKGLGAARNTGISVCSGEYLIHIDSDDYIEKETIKRLVEEALRTKADVTICGYKRVYRNHSINCPPAKIADIDQYRKNVVSGCTSHTIWGKLIRASIYTNNKISAINGLHQGEDYAVYPKIVYFAKNVRSVDGCFYNYVMRNDLYFLRVANIKDTADSINEIYKFFKSNNVLEIFTDSLEQYRQKMKCWLINSWVLSKHANDDFPQAIAVLFPLSKIHPALRLDQKIILFLFDNKCFVILKIMAKFISILQSVLNKSLK